jgi:hypothetical protein
MVREEGTSYRFPIMKMGISSSFSFFSASIDILLRVKKVEVEV